MSETCSRLTKIQEQRHVSIADYVKMTIKSTIAELFKTQSNIYD